MFRYPSGKRFTTAAAIAQNAQQFLATAGEFGSVSFRHIHCGYDDRQQRSSICKDMGSCIWPQHTLLLSAKAVVLTL